MIGKTLGNRRTQTEATGEANEAKKYGHGPGHEDKLKPPLWLVFKRPLLAGFGRPLTFSVATALDEKIRAS
jgi:hypothetical protein